MRLSGIVSSIAIAAGLALIAPARADVVIDDFSNPNPSAVYFFGSTNPFSNTLVSGSVLGGSRLYTATQSSGATFDLVNAGGIGTDASLTGDQGAIRFGSGGPLAVEAVLRYPATGNFSSPIDFTALGDSFRFDFAFTDGGTGGGSGALLETLIEVFTTSGTRTNMSNFPDSVGLATFTVPFSSFGGSGSFSSVTALRVTLNDPETNTDFQLNQFSITGSIPEPVSLAIWGVIGVAGCCYARRRRTVATPA